MKGFISSIKKYFRDTFRDLVRRSKTRQFYIVLGLLFILYLVFYANALHERFTDEFDNILGGMYILQGKLPYTGFFSHHGPFAYFLGAFVALFSGDSFVRFRIVYSVVLFLITLSGYYFVRKSLGELTSRFYLGFMVVYAVASTYFWGHLFVADSLSAILLAPVLAILLVKPLKKQALTLSDFFVISFFSAAAVLTSLTYSYLIAGLYGFSLLYYFVVNRPNHKLFNLKSLYPFIVLGIPYAIFLLYLVITGSLMEYIRQSIIFNQNYYIYNYPRPEGATNLTINPVRYAVIIMYEFFGNFRDILLQARDFNFNFPFNITLAIGNLFMLLYLLIRRRFLLALFLFCALAFANARSNPLESSEKDFQSAVYIIISFLNITFLLTTLWKKLASQLNIRERIVFSFMFFVLAIYSFFAASFLVFGFVSKTFNKYMGYEPRVYNQTLIAPIVNSATSENEVAWIGPIAFEELMYLERPLPSKYHILIPGIGRSQAMSAEMLEEFNTNKPIVIWLDKRYSVLGQAAPQFAPFFMDFLNKNYVTLYNEETEEKKYESVLPIETSRDVETMLYIRKDKFDEVVERLQNANLVRPAQNEN